MKTQRDVDRLTGSKNSIWNITHNESRGRKQEGSMRGDQPIGYYFHYFKVLGNYIGKDESRIRRGRLEQPTYD
jgi:hypothetical protein